MDKNDNRAVENARQRYSQLVHTLTSFQNALIHSEQLIPWPNQQAQFSVLSSNLESISKTLSQNFPTLPPPTLGTSNTTTATPAGAGASSTAYRPPVAPSASQPNLTQDTLIAYPNAQFPSRNNETLIGMLFRKKPQPYVSEWMAEGKLLAQSSHSSAPAGGDGVTFSSWLSDSETYTLWNSAVEILRELSEQRDWDDAYTMEEREAGTENVQTALRPEMMEIGTLDEKGKRKITVSGASDVATGEGGLKMEQFFRFWTTGMVPAQLQEGNPRR